MEKDFKIIIDNSQNGIIKFSSPDELKGMKIIDSFLGVSTDSTDIDSNTSYNVRFKCIKDQQVISDEDKTFVDIIKFVDNNLLINISEELQFAIDNNADLLSFELVDGGAINFNKTINLKTEYISKTSYKDNSSYHNVDLGRAGNASINIATGDLSIRTPIISSDQNVLPLSITANYNSLKSDKLPEIGLPKQWNFNFNQFLVEHYNEDEDKLVFTFIDENGKEHLIEETYFYYDKEGNEIIVARKDLELDFDNKLVYKINDKYEPVHSKLESPTGIKLISSLKHEHEPDQLIQIRETIDNLNNTIDDINTNIESLRIGIFAQCLNNYLSEHQLNSQMLSNVAAKKEAAKTLDKAGNKVNAEYNIYYEINDAINKNKITQEDIEDQLKKYMEDKDYKLIFTSQSDDNITNKTVIDSNNVDDKVINYLDNIYKELTESSRGKKTAIYDFLDYYNVYLDNSGPTPNTNVVDKTSLYHKELPNLVDVNIYYNRKNIEDSIARFKKYKEQLELYNAKLEEYEHQKDLYEMQVPVHYLYSDNNIVYGFGRTDKNKDEEEKVYRLVLITDAYENGISINYESFEDNKIKSIVDSSDKVITFGYNIKDEDENKDEEYLCVITDARDRKVKIKQIEHGLRVIHVNGSESNFYYNDNHIVKVLNGNGFGVDFTYKNNKVSSISQISALIKDEKGKIKLNDNLDFNIIPTNNLLEIKDTIRFVYNDYMSTSIINSKNKRITYLFDKYGKVRTQYESFVNEKSSQEDNNETIKMEFLCKEVTLFDYQDNKVNRKIKNLPYSRNYLYGAKFKNSNVMTLSDHYFGNTYCAKETLLTSYKTFEDSHVMKSKENDITFDSLKMSGEMVDELNNKKEFPCPHRAFVVSGWAKADSAFISDEEKSNNDTNERTFKLKVNVTYEDETVDPFEESFDWRNTDWQLCAVYVSLKHKKISEIECTIEYSYNTGNIVYTDLEFKEANYDEIKYDKLLRPKTAKSAHSEWTVSYEYDGDTNNVIKETYSRVKPKKLNDSASNQTTEQEMSETQEEIEEFYNTYVYNKEGKLIKSIDFNNIVTEQVYNDKGQIIKTMTYHKDEPANKYYKEINIEEDGTQTNNINELGEKANTYKYVDGTGIVETTVDENGVKTSYGYDDTDTLLQVTTTVDNISNTNVYGYELEHLTSLKHNGFEYKYKYDIWGRLAEIKIDEEIYLTKIYQDNEEITELKPGETFKQTFNDDDQVVDTYLDQKLLSSNVYDSYGRIECTKDYVANTETNIEFDNFGNVIKTTNKQHGVDVILEDTYGNNHKDVTDSKITIGSKKLNYIYGKSNEKPETHLDELKIKDLSSDSDEIDIVTQHITYDKLDRVSLITQNNTARSYEYLSVGDHTTNVVSKINFSIKNKTNDSLKYKFDNKGNIIEIRKNNSLIVRYSYDSLSRVIREDNKDFDKTVVFEYDAGGNIITKTEFDFTLVENLDYLPDREKYIYNYPISGWKDKLLSYNDEKFDYDKLGNPTLYRDKELDWTYGRVLNYFDVTRDEEGNIIDYKSNYAYNANGVRTKKVINVDKLDIKEKLFCLQTKEENEEKNTCYNPNCECNNRFTTDFILNGNRILQQKDCCNVLDFYYGVDGILGFHLKNNSIDKNYFYKKNAQNDIIGIYDEEGLQIVKYEYDAWGNQQVWYYDEDAETTDKFLAITKDFMYNDTENQNIFIAFKNPFRYRSYYYDFETGLYYLNSRYYDPELCRFVNVDDISILEQGKDSINGLNLYCYCLNNPVNDIDSNGQWSWSRFFKALAIVAVVVAVVAVTVLTAGAGSVVGTMVVGATIAAGVETFNQAVIQDKSFSDVNWLQVGISAIGGAIGSIPGLNFVGSMLVSGLTSGLGTLASGGSLTDAAISFGVGLIGGGIGYGVGKAVSKIGASSIVKKWAQMSKTQLKKTVQGFFSNAERNSIKNISYILSKNPNLPFKIFGTIIPQIFNSTSSGVFGFINNVFS